MTFFCENVKISETVLELERGEKNMKKAVVFLMIVTLSVSGAACGNKEKADNKADAKTEQSQNADNSKDNDKSDTQTKAADNKMYE